MLALQVHGVDADVDQQLHTVIGNDAHGVAADAGADGAVLALKDNMNVFGKICGNEGGKTDAEVDNIAVFKFFCNTRCDERLYLSLIH